MLCNRSKGNAVDIYKHQVTQFISILFPEIINISQPYDLDCFELKR